MCRVFPKLTLLIFALLLCMIAPVKGQAAQGKTGGAIKPDPTAVFFTMMLERKEPVSRRNVLVLPSPAARAVAASMSSDPDKTSASPGTNPLSLSFSRSSYERGAIRTVTAAQPEAQETIIADPSDRSGDNLVTAISDFSRPGGFNFTKWAVSIDGGESWAEALLPYDMSTGLLITSDGQAWTANSDPAMAFDRFGNVFLSDLYIRLDAEGRIIDEGLYVSADSFKKLETGNFSRTNPVFTNLSHGSVFNIEDKPWIAVDKSNRSTAGYVYTSWSHFSGCRNHYSALSRAYELKCTSDVIYVAYSKNHGRTWSTPYTVNAPNQDGAVQASQVAVGPDGKVYVAYELFGHRNRRQQYLSMGMWNDGSLEFSAPFPVTPVFHELTFSGCATCRAGYRVNSFPNLAVGPGSQRNPSGNVYLVYGAQTTRSSPAQVNFVACTGKCTGSKSFISPRILNDSDVGDHFFPAIAVDQSGVIHCTWLDTRKHPSDPDSLDVYAAFLTYSSKADSFIASQNVRVTPFSNHLNLQYGWGGTDYIGDYIGIAVTATTPVSVHPVWTSVSGILGVSITGSLQTSTLLCTTRAH